MRDRVKLNKLESRIARLHSAACLWNNKHILKELLVEKRLQLFPPVRHTHFEELTLFVEAVDIGTVIS